jgi:hypothetical protein
MVHLSPPFYSRPWAPGTRPLKKMEKIRKMLRIVDKIKD